jgi:nucleotide-binding universal stress UspA family protein
MTAPTPGASLSFRRIFHPTDFSVDSHTALIHALKLAVAGKAELTTMHIDPAVARADFEDFPRIRPILEEWRMLPPNSTKEQVRELGLTVRKVRAPAANPREALLAYLTTHPTELLVMTTHQYEGPARWHHQLIAEPVARGSHTPTLFVPAHVEGFVAKETGKPRLRRVLVPVSARPNPQVAIDTTTQLVVMLGCESLTGILVHVGDDATFHSIRYPSRNGWLWHTMTCHGNVVDVILGMGADFDVDLIVMTTEGHNSLLDMVRGSTMELVLRGARCPLLALPV